MDKKKTFGKMWGCWSVLGSFCRLRGGGGGLTLFFGLSSSFEGYGWRVFLSFWVLGEEEGGVVT